MQKSTPFITEHSSSYQIQDIVPPARGVLYINILDNFIAESSFLIQEVLAALDSQEAVSWVLVD